MQHQYGEFVEMTVELRLRQWARRNYIPVGKRDDGDWHPVVLDEMRRKDRELETTQVASLPVQNELRLPTVVMSAGIVPLEPSRHEAVRIDQAHASVPTPGLRHTTEQDANRPVETFIPYYL